ncbi:hypothetical protein RJ640_021408 [Escallonia rubra]|uniref:Pectinesterase inhibitor domain-containing protein n=1 Tax=Escallonia rubra TaxID=112253 RepID=A0AA88UC55_9ASTE|nr:hypothetical protein RJ640_021408 [Escallonia rubra]
MASCSCSILLPLLLVFLVIHPSFCDDDTQSLIRDICRQTLDFTACNDIFQKNLPSPRTNVVGLAQITVTQSLLFASDTSIFIHRTKEGERDKTRRDLYTICEEGYSVIMDLFEEADRSFAQGNYRDVVDLEHQSTRPINDCGTNVKINQELIDKNRHMALLVNMGIVGQRIPACDEAFEANVADAITGAKTFVSHAGRAR